MPRWVEKRAIASTTEKEPEAAPRKVEAEKGVYSRRLMLKVLEAQKEPRQTTACSDSTATASGRSSPEVQDEGDKAHGDPVSLAECLPETGLKLRPRARSEGQSDGAAWAAAEMMPAPTTVMLRNIPNQYSREKLCQRLDAQGMKGEYDFLYLPIDRNSERNMGYAFINFRSHTACSEFTLLFNGKLASDCLPGYKSNKVCEVRVAEVQGQQANLEKMTSPNFFQHLADHEEWQPIFFDANGEKMPLAAREYTEGNPGKRSRTGSSPPMGAFMSPGMVPYFGLPMSAIPANRAGAGAELCAEAPEFIPSTSSSGLGPSMPPSDSAASMAMRHMRAEAAARAAAQAHARTNAARPKDIKKQIEYYFSKENIGHDMYLRKLMDVEGWVGLDVIVKFPKLRALHADVITTAKALTDSDSVEISEDKQKIRIKSSELRESFPKVGDSAASDVEASEEAADDSMGKQELTTAAGGA